MEGSRDKGFEQQTFLYIGAHLTRIGPEDSELRWVTRQRGRVSNTAIIPIRRGERAAPGDIVLTSWASGSGLQRAIVVAGGSAVSPKVRYLDLALDHAAAHIDEPDVLPPNTFHVLREPGEIGSSVACSVAGRAERLIVVKRTARALLGLGFAGRMFVVKPDQCVPLPLHPAVKPGDRVYVATPSGFVNGQVERVDNRVGRVSVLHSYAGAEQRTAAGFTNVAVSLPPL